MGDVAMTVPVLRAFTQQYPDIKITVLTNPFFKPFFRDLKNVEVYEADLKGKHKGVFGLYKLSKSLKRLNFNAIADLHNVLRSNILKYFLVSKKNVQINKGRAEKKALIKGKQFQQLKTTHQRYADVFTKLGYPVDLHQVSFPKRVKLSKMLKTYIPENGLPLIGIAPFATYKSKMYPLNKTEVVIKELSKTFNIILFGSKTEAKILDQLASTTKNVVSVAGQLSLDNELDIISNLQVMIAMDSGNAHIAAMLGIKVITIWGVTHPYAGFAPFNQPLNYALTADRATYPLIPTSIYGNKYPENYEKVAGSISTQTIINKVNEII